MSIELIVVITTALLVGATWLLYRLADRLRSREMSGLDIIGLFLALALGVYLVVALLKPEKFQ